MFKSLLPWKHTKTKVMVSEQIMDDERNLPEQHLIPCSTCGRTFLPLPLKKHAPICEKSFSKRRKVFDSLKQRVEGTDLAHFHQKSYLKRQDSVPKVIENPKKQWEENHQKLVDAIRSAKGASRDMSPGKKVSSTTANERCPHCERQFGPKAFDRHVEWCKEHQIRVQHSPANVVLAKERLEARIKYKVPPLNKSKRVSVKEKYSPGKVVSRTESICSVKSTPPNPLRRTFSVRKPKSVVDLGGKTNNKPTKVEDKTTSAVSLNEITKKEQNKSDLSPPYDPFISAERQFMELLECDNFKPTTKSSSYRPHTSAIKNPVKTINAKKFPKSAEIVPTKKRASVIDPPVCFQDSDAAEDDFELLENLINDQFNENDDFFLDLNKQNKDDLNVILNRRKYSDDTLSLDSNLINENDDLSIPEDFKFGNYSSNSSEDTDTTIQNDNNVDFYSVQYDKKIEPRKVNNVRTNSKIKAKSNPNSGVDGSQIKKKTNTDQTKNSGKSKTKESVGKALESNKVTDLTVKAENLFSVDDKMYAEYKIYEEMYLKDKEQMINSKKQRSKNSIRSYGIEIMNDEYVQTNKISNDSAYGSLNRNSPKPNPLKLSPLQRRNASASNSESCMELPVNSTNQHQRMSKFCHECGNKYPLEVAKFCPECGVKRLLL